MAKLGPFCQSLGLTESILADGVLPVLESISNGVALELKAYCDSENLTNQQYTDILSKLNPDFSAINPKSIIAKLNRLQDQKKCFTSKKKVKGYKNVKELLDTQFRAPVSQSSGGLRGSSVHTTEMTGQSCLDMPKFVSQEVQTENDFNSDEIKHTNALKHKIKTYTRSADRLINQISEKRECLAKLKSNIGHYSVKNVNKRDETARKNLHKLRDTQRTVLKQQKVLEQQHIKKVKTMENEIADLNDKVGYLTEKYETEKAKKIAAQKTSSYLKGELQNLRSHVNITDCECSDILHTECEELIKKAKLEIEEKDTVILELEETLKESKHETIKTKTEKGTYTDNVRLCIMELAGLEVAVEKMSSVIQAVLKHMIGKELSKDQLPNPSTSQNIVDEGHFIAKTYIADKLENCDNWGLGRDGTTRKKQKILDTSLTLDTGDVISLGFTRVAQETAKTIQNVTEEHLSELTSLNGNPEYLSETLQKLAFTMSDRASNEKLADKLLDEWLERMLVDYSGDKKEVQHFHCMPHVLLGLHNYINPELKDFEQRMKDESGPLGRDALSVFNTWSKKETVVGRVVRTTSDTFGPAGDHLGVRDRWEAYCIEHGIKSLIGNYRDNRFNALFQTSAEVFLHRSDFLKVLNTVSKPNLKLTAVKSDLESTDVCTLLQCLGLFYLKLTGPYWNLVTCGKVPYFELYNHVCEIEQFLNDCVQTPEILLKENEHWSPSDPLELGNVPHYSRLACALFSVQEDTRELLMKVIPVVACAMLKCIKKQLVDFLPGGKFHSAESSKSKLTNFAPVTNLACEHHFGDLDSSQRRRPHASFHHHTSVQLLKRNRKQVIGWIEKMDTAKKEQLLKSARQKGLELRVKHKESEQRVLKDIHENMEAEKLNKGKKRKAKTTENVSAKKRKTEDKIECVDKLNTNQYVAVAYQDSWYPGCIEKVVSENEAVVRFMAPCRKNGFYQWPMREDKQRVNKQFIFCQNFVPDCVSSGRQWFVKEHEDIAKVYSKFHAMYFC